MTAAGIGRAGVASHPGLQRSINEDRAFADEVRGIFLVVDGLGGHAAGETAAEIAVRVIAEQIRPLDDGADPEEVARRAITQANNEIFALASGNPEWHGMACVLTLAIARKDRVTVGHVGDSRLYLTWNGTLRKMTSDHSPVGEQEDDGQLTEVEAMAHPRRNEVFRDVGSYPRDPADNQFIEIRNFLFRPDAALLLCSDGLSDLLTAAQIQSVIEQYDGDPDRTAQSLVDAANQAGGKDNVSVIFLPGPQFRGADANIASAARARHSITRARHTANHSHPGLHNAAWLILGMLLGTVLSIALERLLPRPPVYPAVVPSARAAHAPVHILINAADSHGISKSLELALPGDTIDAPPGEYLGPLELKSGVSIVGSAAGSVILRSDPTSVNDSGLAISARGIKNARLADLRIAADETHPLRRGVSVMDSTIQLENLDISGAIDAGVRMDGDSHAILLANFIHANPGPGIVLNGHATARLAGNWIVQNGKTADPHGTGIFIASDSLPQLINNVLLRNSIVKSGAAVLAFTKDTAENNLLDVTPAREPAHARLAERRPQTK